MTVLVVAAAAVLVVVVADIDVVNIAIVIVVVVVVVNVDVVDSGLFGPGLSRFLRMALPEKSLWRAERIIRPKVGTGQEIACRKYDVDDDDDDDDDDERRRADGWRRDSDSL